MGGVIIAVSALSTTHDPRNLREAKFEFVEEKNESQTVDFKPVGRLKVKISNYCVVNTCQVSYAQLSLGDIIIGVSEPPTTLKI